MPVFDTVVTVDGQAFNFRHGGNPCKGESRAESVPQEALDKESVARALVAEDFHNQFIIPYEMLKELAEEAVKSVNRVANVSISVVQQGKNQ